jgi:hypothetical protein
MMTIIITRDECDRFLKALDDAGYQKHRVFPFDGADDEAGEA